MDSNLGMVRGESTQGIHPRLDLFYSDGSVYLVTQWCPGGHLQNALDQRALVAKLMGRDAKASKEHANRNWPRTHVDQLLRTLAAQPSS